MKKTIYALSSVLVLGLMTGCEDSAKKADQKAETTKKEQSMTPEYREIEKPQVDLSEFTKDADGYIHIFDGKSFKGWRGYGKDAVPGKWTIDDGAIKFNGSGGGEAQSGDGGDIIFAHKFQNFEMELEWKVSKGGNSGIFYLAREIEGKDPSGAWRMEPIYLSSPEAQLLDNANHPDAKLGKDGNRQSMSLYDMIPAKPQNSKPAGEWNKAKVMVYKGTVIHGQNDENVVEYHLWTPQWTDMLQASKFSQEKWPLGFELLNNCGGEKRAGYIGLQDHGDDVWIRNIKIKVLD